MRVMHAGRRITVGVTPDGDGLVSHAGSAAGRGRRQDGADEGAVGRAGRSRSRRGGHDQGRVIRDLAVMLAEGGDCLAISGRCVTSGRCSGRWRSSATAFRVIDRIASDPEGLGGCAPPTPARATAPGADRRARAADDRPRRDADRQPFGEGGRGRDLQGRLRLPPDARLRGRDRRSAGRRTAARQRRREHRHRPDRGGQEALEQIPAAHIEDIELLLRVDSAGASHELLDWCREGLIRYSVGYDLTEAVRAAILQIPDSAWVSALDQDGSERPNGRVGEITQHLDLAGWPAGSRVIVRRERAPRRAADVHR